MKNLAIALIRFYQRHISAHMPAHCRYYPTCSAYAVDALKYHGLLKGGLLTVWRILRCNPLSAGGYDPVPIPKKKRKSGECGCDNAGEDQ